MANNIGKITQIIGAVLDIKFTEGNLPEINDAIKVPTRDGKEQTIYKQSNHEEVFSGE